MIDDKDANKSLDNIEKNAKKKEGSLGKVFKNITKGALAMGAGLGVAAGTMIKFASNAGNAADRLLDLNSITGMSTDSIQQWERVTKIAGVSTDAMTNASQKLTKSMDILETGTGKNAEALNKLGISFDDLNNMNADERMDAVTYALAGVEDKSERARIGTDLLGGSWKEIAPVVDLGTEAMDRAKESANIISEEDLNKANDFRIAMDLMKDRVSFLAMELGIKLIPVAEKFFEWVDSNMPTIEQIFDTVFTIITGLVTNLVNVFDAYLLPAMQGIWNFIEPHFPMIQELFELSFGIMEGVLNGVITAIKMATDFFSKHWSIVEPILIGVAAGAITFGIYTLAIKAASIATGIMTAVTTGFGVAMAFVTSPIGMVIIAIGLLVAAGYLLMKNWDKVKEVSFKVFSAIGNFMEKIFKGLANVYITLINTVLKGLETMAKIALIPINALIKGLNRVPGINIPSLSISMPKIPMLATGGHITGAGSVLVGEEGPEILNLKKGASVVPLDRAGENQQGGSVENNFNIASMVVREESDIKKIARELYNLQQSQNRAKGVFA